MTRGKVLSLALFVALASAPDASLGQSLGSWEGPYDSPLPAIHTVKLGPGDNVLEFSYPVGGGYPSEAWVFDPITSSFRQYPIQSNIFCGGQGLKPNGSVLIVGGTAFGSAGEDTTYLFRESSGFTQVQSMAAGRWYPSILKLRSGKLLAFSGLDINETPNPLVERYSKSLGWTILTGADNFMPLYPMMFLISTGEAFKAGPDLSSEALDPVTGTWRFVATPNRVHYEGSAVLLPPSPNRVMLIGGRDGVTTLKTVEVINFNAASPTWKRRASMQKERHHHNAVLLPDGKVLVVGGGVARFDGSDRPVYRPEVYDPVANTWTLLAAQSVPRLYHSTALLLRDGRVLSAGGDGQLNYEIFSPPYLFNGPRPSLAGVPPDARYGASFDVQTDQADQIATAALLAPGAVTHSFDQNQRYVAVSFQAGTMPDTLTITMPTRRAVAPPGYYMLFLVNSAGVPSVGEFIRLK